MSGLDQLFIVGAGFSSNAGLPLTTQFTEALLDVANFNRSGPSALIVEYLRKFVAETFDHKTSASAHWWPELEDIFTCIDLSANTGHHLGPNYSPAELRTVRRALIVRTIRMLRQRHRPSDSTTNGAQLAKFFSRINVERSAFLSMNWDTVIEEGLRKAGKARSFDYGCNALAARFTKDGFDLLRTAPTQEIEVLKPHGSTNWLYCDACRQLLWFPPTGTNRVAAQLFMGRDWERLSLSIGKDANQKFQSRACPHCQADALGTRFATFSYRKALDFPMHTRTWLSAEELLRKAKTWVFIGYSLPAADYEFKHLMKRVQLSRQGTPTLFLISGGDGAPLTRRNYQKFFGPRFHENDTYFDSSLSDRTLHGLSRVCPSFG